MKKEKFVKSLAIGAAALLAGNFGGCANKNTVYIKEEKKGEINMTQKQPNIILINCDDLGYGDIGCYGSKLNKTPAIDKLAEEGTLFTDFYMPAAVCTPSRAGMLTGCYPGRIGCDTFDNLNSHKRSVLFPGDPTGLNPSEITFAKILKKQGYATKLVGKWHLGDQKEFLPTNHGFDSYFGLPFSNSDCRSKWKPDSPPLPLIRNDEVIQEQPDMAALTERYVDESISFIRENKDKPFLLYLSHMYVHTPLYIAEQFMKDSENGQYGGAVAAIDWSVKAIMYELKKQGMDENTLILLTSDNGSVIEDKRTGSSGLGSNEPLRGWKGSTWEGGIRLPLIARWVGKIPAGRKCSELITAMDFLPTFANLAGGEVPKDRIIDGHDISNILFNEENAKSPYDVFCYYIQNKMTSIRDKKWKLWFQEKELYDLENDVAEKNNLYDKYPEIVKELDKKADKYRNEIGDSVKGIKGTKRRPVGYVENAKPLTEYDPDHPYIIAMYD